MKAVLALAAALSVVFNAPHLRADPSDFAGRWEMTISNSGTTFRACALKLDIKDGALSGEMVWRYGGVFRLDGDRVKLGGHGELLLTGNDEWAAPLTLRRVGGALEGLVEMKNGKTFAVFATPGEEDLGPRRPPRWGEPVKLLAEDGLAGWGPREKSDKFHWTSKDGILTNSERGDIDIVSQRTFQDFQLHLEFKVVKGGNSGVYLRGRYEVQIQDDYGKPLQKHGMGAVYSRLAPVKNASKPAEEWQSYDITLVGRRLTVKLNGETVIDDAVLGGITGGALDPFESRPGPLMLQGDHGKIWFRNIVVTPAVTE